jgi:enamine deaminase RidA (YjgF/YER057c/UK114 family)
MSIDQRLLDLGLQLPQPLKVPGGARYPFSWVRVRGDHAYISGHLPLAPDGSLAEPRGKLGLELTVEQGTAAARLVGLAMLASLQRELGTLDRVTAWLRVLGMVNVAPGFAAIPTVVNGFSNLIVEVFGPDRGGHSRSAVGMANLPFDVAVEVEAEVELGPDTRTRPMAARGSPSPAAPGRR